MRTHSQSFTSGGRGLGDGPRGTTLATLLAGGLVWDFLARDPIGAAFFGLFLLLPREFGFFRWCRGLPPLVSYGILSLTLAWPFLDRFAVSGHLGIGFGRLALILAVWRYHFRRLAPRDHVFLVGVSFFLVLMSLTVAGDKPLAPLGLFGFAAVCALFRLHLAVEEHRVLDLARVRGFEREEAEEIGGREGLAAEPLARALGSLALWIVAGGLLLGWGAPRAGDALADAWRYVVGRGEGEVRPPLPEAPEGPPVFAIPPGARAPVPFGARLARDEFVHRLEEENSLALLHRRVDGAPDDPDILVRMDVYDYLASDMRWIRALASRRTVEDFEDGSADGGIRLGGGDPAGAVPREYLLPPGSGLSLPVVVRPLAMDRSRVVADGTGNLFRAPEDLIVRYRVVSAPPPPLWQLEDAPALAQVEPEFLRLPENVDREALRSLTAEVTLPVGTPGEKATAIADWLGSRCVRHEADRAFPRGGGEPEVAPVDFDPMGFLVDRRWGRNVDFATALALLLRADGIPCRLATGYREGAVLPDGDFRIHRSWHAFAWVEVPFENWGWSPVLATPESISNLSGEDLSEVFEAPPEDRSSVAREKLEEARRPSLIRRMIDVVDGWISSLLPGSPSSSAVGRAVSWLALALAVGLLIRILVGLVGRAAGVASRGARATAGRAPSLPFYERLLRLLSRHGMRRRKAQTPIEFARHVVESWGPEYGDVARLTNAFCAHRYGFRPIPGPEQSTLLARVAALETRLQDRRREARRRMGAGIRSALVLLAALLLAGPAGGQENHAEAIADLGSPVPSVRSAAAVRLEAAGREAVPALLSALRGEVPEEGPGEEIRDWIRKLDAEEYRVREEATEALIGLGEKARKALEEAAAHGSPETSRRARRALARIGSAAPPKDPEVAAREERVRRRLALRLLARIGGAPEIDPIVAAALVEPGLRLEAARAVAALTAVDPGTLAPLVSRPDPDVRRFVVRVLAELPEDLAHPHLLRLRADADPLIREAAARALVTGAVVERTDRARLHLVRREKAEAEELLLAVLRDCPGYGEAGRMLAELLVESGRGSEVLGFVEELRVPPAERERIAARALAASDDLEAALARLHDAARDEPRRTESLVLAAELALAADPPRLGAATDALREAGERAPRDAVVWRRLAQVLSRDPQTGGEAERAWLRAAEIESEERR